MAKNEFGGVEGPLHPILGVYKIHPEAVMPKEATQGAACFDISACIVPGQTINCYDMCNLKVPYHYIEPADGPETITIEPGGRVLVPTGLIFDIPEGYSLRLHARSSLAWKKGLMLANSEGIIDHDYYHETFVMLYNFSSTYAVIEHGERIAQAELVPVNRCHITEIVDAPTQKTDRVGGFGSTGTH